MSETCVKSLTSARSESKSSKTASTSRTRPTNRLCAWTLLGITGGGALASTSSSRNPSKRGLTRAPPPARPLPSVSSPLAFDADDDDDDDDDDDEKRRLSPRRPPADSGPWRPLLLPRVPTRETSIEKSTRRGRGPREKEEKEEEEEEEGSDKTETGCRKPVCAWESLRVYDTQLGNHKKILRIGP